jgi:transposase InsO family protein
MAVRFLEKGIAGLQDGNRRPKSNGQSMPEPVSVELLSIKKKHGYWGAKKILDIYERSHSGEYAPARSTVERLFERTGYAVKRRRQRGQQERIQARVEADGPNRVWTVDFKGWWHMKNKEKVNPLTVRDEHGKFIRCI